eukprot:tig00000492_g1536.t1
MQHPYASSMGVTVRPRMRGPPAPVALYDDRGRCRVYRPHMGQCQAGVHEGSYEDEQCRTLACLTWPMCERHMREICRLEVRTSTIPGAGMGLFAVGDPSEVVFGPGRPGRHPRTGEPLPGEPGLVCFMEGELLTQAQFDRRYPMTATAPYALEVPPSSILDQIYLRGVGGYANDCGVSFGDGRVAFRRGYPTPEGARTCSKLGHNAYFDCSNESPRLLAIRDIRGGDEVFVAYGREYWKGREEAERSSRAAKPPRRGRLPVEVYE